MSDTRWPARRLLSSLLKYSVLKKKNNIPTTHNPKSKRKGNKLKILPHSSSLKPQQSPHEQRVSVHEKQVQSLPVSMSRSWSCISSLIHPRASLLAQC